MASLTTAPSVIVKEKSTTGNKHVVIARLLGPCVAGLVEQLLFHPVDTAAKRLMSNTAIPIFSRAGGFSSHNLSKVVFRDTATAGWRQQYLSMFPGLGFAFGFKVMQRVYKFGGQPFANELVDKHYSDTFQAVFGEKYMKPMMHAASGSLIGMGEIVLLPFDVLKIKMQTNPETLKGRGLFAILRQERLSSLYKGWGWTAARNAPGSFALFGANAAVKEKLFHLENYSQASFFQNFVASSAGGVASIIVASPLDVVKTRLQNRPFDSTETGVQVVRSLVRQEGLGAFFKGLTPKLLVVGPKLIFSFTLAQQLIAVIERGLQ